MATISLTKHFVSVFEETMLSNGFSRKRSVYHRLTDGKILQLLSIKKYSRKNEYDIQYYIHPLCCGGEIDLYMDESRISELLRRDTWIYESECSDSTMYEALELTKQHLLPYFDSVTDYKTYLADIINSRPSKYIRIHNDYFNVNLALCNYEEALISRETKLKWNRDGLNPDNHYAVKQTEEMQNEYDNIKEALRTGNKEYIVSLIKEKEEYSLKTYQENYGVIIK